MTKGVCVFDLDLTLGDFSSIDYFGLVYNPSVFLLLNIIPQADIELFKENINLYTDNQNNFLNELRKRFEKKINSTDVEDKIFRPNIKKILNPLVEAYKDKKIEGFIIYSNNANVYNLEYAGSRIMEMFNTPELFKAYLSRNDPRRLEYDGIPKGDRAKTYATLNKIIPVDENKILFMDDIYHDDLYSRSLTYIHVPPYFSPLTNTDILGLWEDFEDIFNTCANEFSLTNEEIFNLYHIKYYVQATNLEDMEKKYLAYARVSKPIEFHENSDMIKSRIDSYISSLTVQEGGKRKKTRKYKRKTLRKRKL
jgi:hypothetical protein